MAGAHFDSWVAGDGAADNGAGSAVVMEAARILASYRRAARSAPSDSLCGPARSRDAGFGGICRETSRAAPAADRSVARGHLPPYFPWGPVPVQTLPGFADLAAYFNLDNGSGKIRGIYTRRQFRRGADFSRMAVAVCEPGREPPWSRSPPDATDHVFLSRLGLPAFQFIQDPLDYETRVHHTDLDTFDHLRPQDLRQAVVVLASVLLDAANIDRPLPRKALPTQPAVTDPFAYPDPAKK